MSDGLTRDCSFRSWFPCPNKCGRNIDSSGIEMVSEQPHVCTKRMTEVKVTVRDVIGPEGDDNG